jgi:hypothetical protein
LNSPVGFLAELSGKDQFKYIYEVQPLNFVMLPNSKQQELVERFRQFLNSLNSGIRLVAKKSSKEIPIGDDSYQMQFYRYFVESDESIDDRLSSFGLLYNRISEIPSYSIVRKMNDRIILPEGKMVRTFTLYKLSSTLVEGFVSETYGIADEVSIVIVPVMQEQATAKMNKYTKFLSGMILADQQKRRTSPYELVQRYTMAQQTLELLTNGQTRLFKIMVNFVVGGKDRKDLNRNVKLLKNTLQARLLYLDSPRFVQGHLLAGNLGKRLVADTTTAATLFPFVSADIVELPDGVFIGANKLTCAPVIYDVFMHDNYNISTLGTSGSGKSFSTKIIVSRMLQRNPDAALFVFDPENEYMKVGGLLEANVVEFDPHSDMGLNPMQIYSPIDASEIIASITSLPQDYHATLRTIANKADDIEALYNNSPKEMQSYLKDLVGDGTLAHVFRGKPVEFTNRMVFSMKDIESNIEKNLLSLLLFGKVWNMINDEQQLPRAVQKIVVVDEAWLYLAIPAAARFLERTARLGRKRNVCFTINTQRAADVLGESDDKPGLGRAIIENSATKILLRQDELSADVVARAFGLSEREREHLVELDSGNGFLIAQNVHVPIKFIASEEEEQVFTTKPSDQV